MGFYVSDDCISITRGDDAALHVAITDDFGRPYPMCNGDSLTLTVRSSPSREGAVVFSTTSDCPRIIITHQDTADAEVGRYSADIQLQTANGMRHTVWPKLEGSHRYRQANFMNFIIMPEVTTA